MFIFMVHWLGAVKAFEEFKLSIYGDNDDEESAIGNGKANDATKKKK
jgi:ATP-dependent DNA helicase 2 subunit 1